jgi:hypothetical protein
MQRLICLSIQKGLLSSVEYPDYIYASRVVQLGYNTLHWLNIISTQIIDKCGIWVYIVRACPLHRRIKTEQDLYRFVLICTSEREAGY